MCNFYHRHFRTIPLLPVILSLYFSINRQWFIFPESEVSLKLLVKRFMHWIPCKANWKDPIFTVLLRHFIFLLFFHSFCVSPFFSILLLFFFLFLFFFFTCLTENDQIPHASLLSWKIIGDTLSLQSYIEGNIVIVTT